MEQNLKLLLWLSIIVLIVVTSIARARSKGRQAGRSEFSDQASSKHPTSNNSLTPKSSMKNGGPTNTRRISSAWAALSFDVSNLKLKGASASDHKSWESGEGDLVLVSELAPLGGAKEWTAELLRSAADEYGEDVKTIDHFEAIEMDGYSAARWVMRNGNPEGTRGFMFSGFVAVAFRESTIIVKVMCPEYGTTGIREALSKLDVFSPDDNDGSDDVDPYERSLDSEFPEHPLSRARQRLDSICESARIDRQLVDHLHPLVL